MTAGSSQSKWKSTVPSASSPTMCPQQVSRLRNRMLPSACVSPIQRPLSPPLLGLGCSAAAGT